MKLDVVISLGKLDKEKLASDNINELGKVPIMMYHGIREKTANSTGTVGGNVDKDGYNRTPEAFRKDLEYYSRFWDKYEGRTSEVAEKVNDTYLKSNRQVDGVTNS